jgi:molybdopterin-binding protein
VHIACTLCILQTLAAAASPRPLICQEIITVKSTVRNRLEGEVINIVKGGAVAEVEVQTAAGVVSSVITTRSLEELGLKVGDKVVAGFKSTMVFLDKV